MGRPDLIVLAAPAPQPFAGVLALTVRVAPAPDGVAFTVRASPSFGLLRAGSEIAKLYATVTQGEQNKNRQLHSSQVAPAGKPRRYIGWDNMQMENEFDRRELLGGAKAV